MGAASYIAEAVADTGLPEELIKAVIDRESAGREDAVSPAGAIGLMQLMPDTAKELGVDPHDPRQNVLGGARYLKSMIARYGGDVEKGLAAYNAGPGAVDEHGGVPPFAETQAYVKDILGKLKSTGFFGMTGMFNTNTDPYGAKPSTAEDKPIVGRSLWDRTKDKFLNSFYDNSTVGLARLLFTNMLNSGHIERDAEGHRINVWQPTQEDYSFVQKMLPGDPIAQKFALMNATSPQHLQYLVSMKKDDIERAKRVDDYGMDLSSIGTVLGTLLDPINLIPIGQEAQAARILSKYIPKALINTGKIAQWAKVGRPLLDKAEIGATTAALMAADRTVAQELTGFKQDPEMAAKFGAVAGVGLNLLGDVGRAVSRSKQGRKMIATLNNLEDHAYAAITGAKLPQELRKVSVDDLSKIHDGAFIEASGNTAAKELAAKGKLFAVSKQELQDLAKVWGKKVSPTARAFYDPESGIAVFVKDNIEPGANLQGLIDHEIGAHKGLRDLLGEPTYNKLMDAIRKKGQAGEGAWGDAYRAVPDGNPIEVLGNWLERTAGKEGLLDGMTAQVRQGLKKAGITSSFSDGEIKDMVRRSVDMEVDKARGYTVLPNGDVAMDGLLYSANSITNPHTWKDMYDLMPDVRAEAQGVGGWRGWLGQKMETMGPFRTIHGTLKNSVSPLARQIADTLFHDARMRTYKGQLVMSVEKMKEEIKTKLIPYWNDYMDIRSQYIFGDNVKDRLGNLPKAWDYKQRAQEFNRQVRECYNATKLKVPNDNGMANHTWPPEVEKAADTIQALRDRLIELAKKSSSMFGTKVVDMDPLKAIERKVEAALAGKEVEMRGARNMLGPDWKTWDDELWRLRDDDKWTAFVNMFPDVETAVKKMEEYGHLAVKRDVLREKLLAQRQEEWEVDKRIHDRQADKYKKEMEVHKAKKAEWDQKTKQYEADLQDYAVKKAEWDKNPVGKEPVKPKRPLGRKPQAPRKPEDLRDRPLTVDEADLQQYIDNEVYKWAKGQVDRNLHNIDDKDVTDHMPYLHERLPLDTTTKMEMKDGLVFSYDQQAGVNMSLRDDDFDRVIPKIIDRLSGEMALMNLFPSQRAINDTRTRISKQLEAAVKNDALSQNEMNKTLQAFEEGIDHIRGVRTQRQREQTGKWEAFSRMFQSLSYAQNGANMGWNQVGEVGGAIGHVGGRALFHIVPYLGEMTQKILTGKAKTAYLKQGADMLYGDTADRYLWSNTSSFESRLFKEATARGDLLRATDGINTGLNYAARLTSELNFLPRLTDTMIRGVRRDALADAVSWAKGAKFSAFRNPFSDSKLKAAGVDNKLAKEIKDNLNKYTQYDPDGNLLRTDWNKWADESPTSYYKFKFLIDQQAMRAIQQDTIGNRSMLKDAGPGYRILLQFKDFTFKATNGQTFRFLTNPEWDTGLAALYGMASNAAVFALLTGMRAQAYFANDDAKRQKYLEEKLDPATLVKAGFFRNAITGAWSSPFQDIYEASTGDQLFRTTVDRTYQYKRDRDTGDAVGSYVEQLPAVRAITSTWDAAKLGYKAAAPWEQVNKQDIQAFERAFPLANWIPAAYIATEINDSIEVPEKPKSKDKRTLKDKVMSLFP